MCHIYHFIADFDDGGEDQHSGTHDAIAVVLPHLQQCDAMRVLSVRLRRAPLCGDESREDDLPVYFSVNVVEYNWTLQCMK